MKASNAVTTMAVCFGAGLAAPAHAQCTSSWTRDATGGQNARWNQGLVYDSVRQRVVMFGGMNPGVQSEMFWWNGTVWTPIVSDDGPSPREGLSMAYDSARDRIVLFGGHTGGPPNVDSPETWEFDGATWTLVSTTGPQARHNAAMVYDAARGRCVLFAGQRYNFPTPSDTWEWNGSTWQDVSLSVGTPGANQYPSMVYDSDRALTVLTDGRSVWEYAGTQWQLVNNQGPFVRYENAISYDPVRHRVVIFGGSLTASGTSSLPDTWTWDGTQWQLQAGCGPGARISSAMVFDVSRSRHVLYGGISLTGINPASTWSWDGVGGPVPPTFISRPSGIDANAGVTVTMSSLAISTAPVSYQWRRNAAAVNEGPGGASVGGGTVGGAQTASLTITAAAVSDTGTYDLVGSNALGQATSLTASVILHTPPPPPPDHCESPNCYPNCDQSTAYPCLTANDFQCYLNQWSAGNSYANCDGSTTIPNLTANDFQCFLGAYAAGCT